uniref:Peptidase aspartic putative domain-containing protein n=1 Tax=Anopheles minimus TaxID=112268 RepID=A0A182W696_9DIPT
MIFRIVPVTVHNGGLSIDTFAFLDEGSSLTLVEAGLASKLKLNGTVEPLVLRWTANVTRKEEESQLVNFDISVRGEERRYNIAAAHTVKELSLPSNDKNSYDSLISSFTHLQHLPTTPLVDAKPTLLIGLRDVGLIKPLETRYGRPNEPIAVKGVLGWAIYGPNHVSAVLGEHQSSSSVVKSSRNDNREKGTDNDVTRFSKWKVLLRTVALVRRFSANCRLKRRREAIRTLRATEKQLTLLKGNIRASVVPIESEEYKKAEDFLIQMAQRDGFSKELDVLRKIKDKIVPEPKIEHASPSYNLDPFMDDLGIIRMDGRTANATTIPLSTPDFR